MFASKKCGETTKEFSDRIKKELDCKKVCICGKLDPMSRGITRILLDNDTKKMQQYLSSDKEYEFYIVPGISTKSDDILGEITFNDKSNDEKLFSDMSKIINFMENDYIKNNYQKYHHYSAINIEKNGIRKPLWYWYKMNKLKDYEIPSKKVKISELKYLNNRLITGKLYILDVLYRLSLVRSNNFNIEQITNNWKKINTKNVILIKFRISVSSGFYVRQIPGELKKKLNIHCHIFDINRINILENYTKV